MPLRIGGPSETTTSTRTAAQLPEDYKDVRPTALYLSPWVEGKWSLRDAVDVMVTASIATLRYGAKFKDDVLYNLYQAGRDQIKLYSTKGPFAYIIPQDQRDVIAAVELLRRLAFGGVRISQLTAAARFDDTMYPGGTWIIRTDREYAALAREVLDIQKYPDLRQSPGGPPERPYDAAGWTLPLQMDVRVIPVAQPLSDDTVGRLVAIGPGVSFKSSPTRYVNGETDAAAFDSVPGAGFNSDPAASAIVPPPGRIAGTGSALAVDPAANNAFRAINRAWKEGAGVQFRAANGSRQPRYIVTGLPADRQTDLVRALAMPVGTDVVLTDSLSNRIAAEAVADEATLVAQALRSRPDLVAEEERVRAARQGLSAIKAERLPSLGLVADDGVIGKNGAKLLNTYTWGLQVSVPIFDGFRREARVQEQQSVVKEAEIRQRDLEQQAHADVRGALIDLGGAREQLAAATERLRLAEQELAQARDRFNAGVAGNADVVNASLALTSSRMLVNDAETLYQLARVALARATGSVTTIR